jgi:diguanylate cyclase (GGDEF)-like protein
VLIVPATGERDVTWAEQPGVVRILHPQRTQSEGVVMAQEADDLALHRARRHPELGRATSPATVVDDPAAQVDAHASAPEMLDLDAGLRDAAAATRDQRATTRDSTAPSVDSNDRAAVDRMLAARDRAAAALDRREAALDRQRAAEYLRRAYRDPLTGVLQREAGRDQLSQRIGQARRTDAPLVIAFLDVDQLKELNDEQGHAAGDRLLHELGAALRTGLRSYDLAMRYGGDEFVCALSSSGREDARRRFEQIRHSLAATVPGAAFSVGLVELQAGEQVDDVIARADREMYGVKRAQPAETRQPLR